eukprot:GILI01003419.1.p1 GENE.GILI01003419.1~~GILI01003419.1.p1  ORF type:complete len:212 (-),score=34.10 GILI01003419.1:236-817(-)
MGQKVNPIIYRILKTSKTWDHLWHSRYQYSQIWAQSKFIQDYITQILKQVKYISPSAQAVLDNQKLPGVRKLPEHLLPKPKKLPFLLGKCVVNQNSEFVSVLVSYYSPSYTRDIQNVRAAPISLSEPTVSSSFRSPRSSSSSASSSASSSTSSSSSSSTSLSFSSAFHCLFKRLSVCIFSTHIRISSSFMSYF